MPAPIRLELCIRTQLDLHHSSGLDKLKNVLATPLSRARVYTQNEVVSWAEDGLRCR